MNWRPPPTDPAPGWLSRWRRWLIPAALFALMPKCLLCVLAYAGLGASLGLGGPELCGAAGIAPAPWTVGLALAGSVTMVANFTWRRFRRHSWRSKR